VRGSPLQTVPWPEPVAHIRQYVRLTGERICAVMCGGPLSFAWFGWGEDGDDRREELPQDRATFGCLGELLVWHERG
jgi:hypothetical protein